MIFKHIKRYGNHEKVLYFQDEATNLKGIIAIHNRILGPSLGGCRMWPYSSEEDALIDVLKLSRSMTYKAAMADLPLGGGKAVIIGELKHKTPELFKAFGRVVHALNGSYITAEDVGTNTEDMHSIRSETPFVTGLSKNDGGAGDPSIYTARSTLIGIKAAVFFKLRTKSLQGLKVSIQGIGHVGNYLAEELLKQGCIVNICDILESRVLDFKKKHPEVNIIPYDKIYDTDCDVFSPCALGGIINPKTWKQLKCSIIAGAANNQLDSLSTEEAVHKNNILYVPDFVLNAGGLISVFTELKKTNNEVYKQKKIDNIYNVLINVFNEAKQTHKTPTEIVIEIAKKKLNKNI